MDDTDDCKKETRAQRKRKGTFLLSDNDLSSDDSYIPPNGPVDDSSDDSDHDEKKLKKLKTVKTVPSNTVLEKKKKKSRHKGRPPLEASNFQMKQKMFLKKRRSKKRVMKGKGETKVPVLKTAVRKTPFLGPNSIIGFWYIASGFTKDLTILFKAFDELESWRFSAFATCWQNLKFSLIYRGRHSFKELLEFTEEVCLWTKKFTSPIHSPKWRVGALYALYGLYHKHPIKHCYKIRLEADEYEHLEHLARSFQNSAENPDPAYVFFKLKADAVFYYVATSDEMGLNFYSQERQQDIMNYEAQWVLHEHSASSIFPEHECNIQKVLMEEYNKVKLQVWGNGNEQDKTLSYVQPGLLSQVDAILAGLKEDRQDTTLPRERPPEEPSIGQKRQAIRERAAALSTTDDFFKRKQLRSPQKSSKVDSLSRERSNSFSGDETTQEDHLSDSDENKSIIKVEKLRGLMELMKPSSERTPGNSLRFVRKETPQENLHEENTEATTAVCTETEDIQDILLPSGCLKQKHLPEYQKKIKSPQQNGKVGNPGSSSSLQEDVGHKETPKNKKGTSLPPKKRKRMPKESKKMPKIYQLRNFRYKATEQPQVIEENEIPREENIPQSMLEDPLCVLGSSVSVSNIENSYPSQEVAFSEVPQVIVENEIPREENMPEIMLMDPLCVIGSSVSASKTEKSYRSQVVALSEVSSPRSKNRSLRQGRRRRGKPRKNRLRKKVTLYQPFEHESGNIPEEDSMIHDAFVKKYSSVHLSNESKMTEGMQIKETDCSREAGKKNVNLSDKDSQAAVPKIALKEVCDNEEANSSTESVCKEICDTYTFRMEDPFEKVGNQTKRSSLFNDQQEHESISKTESKETVSESLSQGKCDEMNLSASVSPLSDQPNYESIPHTVGNKQTVENPASQQNSDTMTSAENTINVEISARVPKKKYYQPMLSAESMVILQINYLVKNVLIDSKKFKITKKDLESIRTDETKLEKFKKKFHSLLPPEYKDYELLLQLTDHDVVFRRSGTSFSACSEQEPQPTPKNEHSKQDPQPTPGKHPAHNFVDVAANTSTTVHAEQTPNFRKGKSSSEETHTYKEREKIIKTESHTSQEPGSPDTVNSLQKFVEAKTTEAGSKVITHDDVDALIYSQINRVETCNKSKPSTVQNTNDGGETTSKLLGNAEYDRVLPGSLLTTVMPQSEIVMDESNESVGDVLKKLPSTEKVSDIITRNEFGCMRSKYAKEKVSSQDNASVDETTNPRNIGGLNIIDAKPPSSLSPPTTLPANSLHARGPDGSVSNANSNSICSFYFFSKRSQKSLPTKKSTKSSSGQV